MRPLILLLVFFGAACAARSLYIEGHLPGDISGSRGDTYEQDPGLTVGVSFALTEPQPTPRLEPQGEPQGEPPPETLSPPLEEDPGFDYWYEAATLLVALLGGGEVARRKGLFTRTPPNRTLEG